MTRSPVACLDAEVLRIEHLSESFRRVTFGGPGMARFGLLGPPLDLRIKLVIPPPDQAERFDLPSFLAEQDAKGISWYQAWLRLDEAERGSMRTYTARAWRPEQREMDVDIVLHEHGGPAMRWAADAQVGQRIHMLGPDRDAQQYGGIEFTPASTRDLLLVGDETAVPAIASILESLPLDAAGHAVMEVPVETDQLPLTVPDGVQVHCFVRDGHRHGALLDAAVRDLILPGLEGGGEEPPEVDIDGGILWETAATAAAQEPAARGKAQEPAARGEARAPGSLGPDFYAWIAGEAGTVTGIRRYLVKQVGVHRRQVAFMGYWREGRAEGG